MAELDRLEVKILGDVTDLRKKMSQSEKIVEQFGYNMQQVGKTLTAGLTLPLTALGAAAVKSAVDMDKLERGLRVSAGSAAGAAQQMKELERIAKQPGLGFKEAIAGATQLNVALEGMEDRLGLSTSLLSQFGNAIALTGGGAPELQRVTTQLGQIAAAGKVLTQDLRPIIQTAPAVGTALRRAFGTISPEEINALGLTSQEFFDRLLEGLGSLERAAEGPANTFENLRDSLFRTSATIGEDLLPVVIPLVDNLNELLEATEGASRNVVQWGISIAATAAMIGPALIAVGSLTKLAISLRIAGMALVPVFGVGGLLVGGLSLLTAHLIKNKLETAEFTGRMKEATEAAKDMGAAMQELNLQQQRAAFADLATGVDMFRARLADLSRQRAELVDQLKDIPQAMGFGGAGQAGTAARLAGEIRELDGQIEDANRQIALFEEMIAAAARGMTTAATTADTLGTSLNNVATAAERIRSLSDVLGAPMGEGFTSAHTRTFEDWAGDLTRAKAAAEEVTKEGQRLQDVAVGITIAFSDTLVNALSDGKKAFKAFADYAIDQLLRLAADFAILSLVSAILPGTGFAKALGGAMGFSALSPGGAGAAMSGVSTAVPSTALPDVRGTGTTAPVARAASPIKLVVNVPPARDPISFARDAQWHRALAATLRELEYGGMQLGPG